MKVCIVTLHRAENYGSVLQALALQLKIEALGHKVVFLDYCPERYTKYGKLKRLKGKDEKFNNPFLLLIARILIFPSYLKKGWVFGEFLKNLNLYPSIVSSSSEVDVKLLNADAFCVGSDQVWNSYWNEGIDGTLFLDFVNNGTPCFSYASSIGLSELPESEIQKTKELLAKFRFISVREDTGVNILRNLGRNDVVQSIDPTLLLTAEDWNPYVKGVITNEKYILTYNLHHDKKIDDYAVMLEKKYGYKIYNVSYNWHDVVRHGNLKWCPSVGEFLGLIKNAHFVVADSFHATVFSILFKKKFVSIAPEIANSRISSLLSCLGLGERLINNFDSPSVIEVEIDYDEVFERLQNERNVSLEYLKNVFNSIK
jgi:hypothetical protein